MIHLFFRKKREGVNSMETVFENIDSHLLHHTNICLPQSGASIKTIVDNIRYARQHRTNVNHISGEVHYIAIGTGRNTVLTIHDVGSAMKGGLLSRVLVKTLWFWIPALIVKRITVISEFTKKELSALLPFAKHKIIVIHNAFCPAVTYKEKAFNGDCPVILHMGTKENKNLERTIEALKDIKCHLNVVGKLSGKQKVLLEESGISYENHYDVAYSQIVEFYQSSDIVSFPSTYEGFGVPILEANAAGRPIIAGDIEVLHEVAEESACFVNPYEVKSIRTGFERVIKDKVYRQSLVEKGFENIKRFAPKVIAEKYNSVYKEIAQS